LHTVDPEQRPETAGLLTGSSVKAVELWESKAGKEPGYAAAMRQGLAAAGVTPRTVHAAFSASLDLSSPDPAVRAAGVAAVGAALELAEGVGAGIIVVHPSSEPIADADRAARMDLAKGSVRAIAEMAEKNGSRIALEWLPRTCLGRSADELLALATSVDGDTVGVCLDTNHLMGDYAALPEAVRRLGPRLIALHCSDYDGVDEQHWPPGRGVIDWAAFLAALQEIEFAGPFNYEAGLDGETPAEKLAFLEANYAGLVAVGR
jgi:sugar phosphate isomerase/epimerase